MSEIQVAIDNINGNPKFINTSYFREAAIHFRKYGRYTFAPIGSKDWWEYWEEQERRCLEGFKVGGTKITGRHYFYMNFTQMKRSEDEFKGKKVATKDLNFPAFWEIDYDWWWYKEIAWFGIEKEKLLRLHLWRNPVTLEGARHLSCAKTRRGGFSYKEGADGVYNYNFIDGSISYYFADLEAYLTDDGILSKVMYDLDFLNKNTDGFWLKNRMQNSTLMHQTASYKPRGSNSATGGTQSQIIGLGIGGNPDKVRGKDGVKITYEEGGSFRNLKKSLMISIPSVTEGNSLTGQVSVFGTGGDDKGAYIEGLEEVVTNPNDPIFRFLAFLNDWESGYGGTEIGVFVPYYMANKDYMDLDGNINRDKCIADEEKTRGSLKAQKDHKKYDQRIAEFPSKPSESFLRIAKSSFPRGEILLQKQRVLQNRDIQGLFRYGELVNDPEKGWTFQAKPKIEAKPIDYYPHKDDDDLNGCITMVEDRQYIKTQQKISDGRYVEVSKVPDDVYLIVVDPYYKDNAEDKTSLGVARVLKIKSHYFSDPCTRCIAWFVGRPDKVSRFQDIVLDMAEYWNAKVQSEISGGGQGLFDKAKTRKKLHRLCFEPMLINGVEIEKMPKNRNYFINTSDDDKALDIEYYSDFLKTVVGIDEKGNEIWQLHYEYDVALLEELSKHNDEGNFDRLSAMLVAMRQLKEKAIEDTNKKRKSRKNNSNNILGGRILFGGEQTSSLAIMKYKNGELYI